MNHSRPRSVAEIATFTALKIHMVRFSSFCLIALLSLGSCVFAQTGNIRGFVYEKETQEPVIFTPVYIPGTRYQAQTDVNGYFSITRLPQGKYTVVTYALGYDTVKTDVYIMDAGEIVTKKIFLPKKAKRLKELVVSSERSEARTEVKTSITKITPKEMKRLPTVGGEPDLAQYLQVVPGVTFTGDQGGQLYIRGGSPVMNKVLLDGMVIYNPFHSIGLFSVFDADIIRNADVYTGGFGAQYGGRISSIMDITTRDGNKKRTSGKIATNTFGSKILLEGPLLRAKSETNAAGEEVETNNTTLSYLFSAKNSYLSKTSPILYKSIANTDLPFDFTDLYGKVSLNGSNGSKVNFFGFRFDDRVKNYQGLADFNWVSSGMGSNFLVVPAGTKTMIRGFFSYSQYLLTMLEKDGKPRSSGIDGFNAGFDFTNFVGQNEVLYGVEATGFSTDYTFTNSYNVTSEFKNNNTEVAGFIRYKMNFGKLILDPSFRLHYYASLNEASPEPRMGAKYLITDRFRLKAAGGLYSQNLMSASSDRDVVNLFYGFLSSPSGLQKTFRDKDGQIRDIGTDLQTAWHAIFGFEYELSDRMTLNVEGYNKAFSQLININQSKKFDDTAENAFRPDEDKKDYIIETGFARGIDFNLKYDYKRLYLWAVYSLGYITRYDGTYSYLPHFDRRHNINLVGSYVMGKHMDWEINARWNMGSGFPFTRTQGAYELLDFNGGINQDYTQSGGQLGFLYGARNAGRLPYYHRLDVTIKKKFFISENSVLEVSAGATNAYNRQNIFYRSRVTNQEVYQLPILPTLALNWTF